jgi:hypothetical protein
LPRKEWSDKDIQRIKEVYSSGILKGDGKLDALAKELGVLKSNLCRKARSLGLTLQHRELTSDAKANVGKRVKEWLKENPHPKGFQGKTHTEEARKIMSEVSVAYHENCTAQELANRIDKMLETRKANGNWMPAMKGYNMYSRAKSGKRKDLDNMFFRSRTEANYARYLKHKDIEFQYEPTTFWFEGIKKGTRAYIPDFYLPEEDEWHEFKGWLDAKSQTKFRRMKKYHPDVFKKMVVIMERLTPKTKDTLRSIGFTEEQIRDFRPIDKHYKDVIKHWEK